MKDAVLIVYGKITWKLMGLRQKLYVDCMQYE